ncbi:hypothetical protein BU14_0091s0002 [Porphyra umbilicalis]|uniref:Vesicle-fusing ATPase n=1 Tax=Porphyra umbilicalis TaxID=2786 RepID=A0A1X6PDT8_PORUM|nr:hypothetical protein BU14_0091s0002 [Porphyra umbilicalis]|eukprot:OSX79022.1 hypothetical protein BU14_0091s0002 [Porphyra umbilicalis]
MSWKLGGMLGGGGGGGTTMRAASCPSQELALSNRVYTTQKDLSSSGMHANVDGLYLAHLSSAVRTGNVAPASYVYAVAAFAAIEPGCLAFNAIQRRELQVALGDDVTLVPFLWPGGKVIDAAAATFEVDALKAAAAAGASVDGERLVELLGRRLRGQVASLSQTFVVDFYGTNLTVKVSSLATEAGDQVRVAALGAAAELFVAKAPGTKLKLSGGGGAARPKEIFRADFDFEKMGIGGLDKEFSAIFRRAFASRVFPPAVVSKLGVSHVKGMLLYGPPGTGKTLIARQIGKMLNGREPQVVNGPEILNKFVGQSEENIRKLFEAAEAEYAESGDASELHIIIFDEIDAICKQRGSAGAGAAGSVHDTVVNQLLSKIDGVNSLNNILVIGMTNRKDMIDEALLRPGRLEVHVEISLPDEHGRAQILRIHTGKMRDNKMLGPDVSVESIAARSKNYSGAELEGVCKSAASHAMNRLVDFRNLHAAVDGTKVLVSANDFTRALEDVQPALGATKDDFARCLLGGFLVHGPRAQALLSAGALFRDEVAHSTGNPLLSVLIEGSAGTGKTALAAKLAVESGFPFVRLVSPEQFVGYSEPAKCAALARVFDDAHKSPLSVVVLDNIERMIEYAPIGPRFSNVLLQTLLVLVKSMPPPGRRLLIVATTGDAEVMEQLSMRTAFNATLSTLPLNVTEVAAVVDGTAVSSPVVFDTDAEGAAVAAGTHGAAVRFGSASERSSAIQLLAAEDMGIKKLLMVLEMARTGRGDGTYAMEMGRLASVLQNVA